MAKRIPFQNLEIKKQYRFKSLDGKNKENTGIDTETYEGYVKLICDDIGNYKEVDNLTEILQFLTRNRFKNKFNWFFNIQYDFESIIKYLDNDALYELYYNGKIQFERYNIRYLPKKFFTVSVNFKNSNTFWDINNFLETSLKKAAKMFLNDNKLDNIDSSRLNLDWDYWIENKDDIIKYCIYDANLTKKIADYFWNLTYKNLNYQIKKPYSKGRLAEEYFLNKCYIPTINDIPKFVLELAYKNYFGGRFELLKRGFYEQVYSYDISSAYPSEIEKLYDYSKGNWKKVDKFNPEADLGFYHCYCECLENNFSPFVVMKYGLNMYPNGKFYQYLNSDEIKFIKKWFKNIKIKILHGVEFILFDDEQPFKEEINYLYNWKEKENNEEIKYTVKIILNSLYGKTIQTVSGKTGKLFNPLYGTLITSRTRLKLLEKALEYPKEIISFSTDSIVSTKELKIKKNPKLGDFKFEFSGKGIFLMSDIYTLWNEEIEKSKLRGIRKAVIKKDTLHHIFESLEYFDSELTVLSLLNQIQDAQIAQFKRTRPLHLGECLIHTKKKNPSMINIFTKTKKDLNINGDYKRFWLRDFINGRDALENNIDSFPLYFDVKK